MGAGALDPTEEAEFAISTVRPPALGQALIELLTPCEACDQRFVVVSVRRTEPHAMIPSVKVTCKCGDS